MLIRHWYTLALALPAAFVVHGWLALPQRLTVAGVSDALTFMLFTALVMLLPARIPWRWLRVAALAGLSLALSVFFVGNRIHWTVFHTWAGPAMLGQWADAPAVAGGVLRSMNGWDWTLGVVIPFAVAVLLGLDRRPGRSRGVPLAVLPALVAAPVCHALLSHPRFDPGEHDPLLELVRRAADRAFTRPPKVPAIASIVWRYYPPWGPGWETGGDPRYPLLRLPTGADPRPLLAIDPSRPPNVVLILMESVRALESGAYGADPSFTPRLDALARLGLTFRNFYANGSQTVRGELAVLCSLYPSLDGAPVYLQKPDVGLNCLPSILRSRGYRTLWVSSMRSSFTNKSGFLSRHGIDEFHDGSDLPADVPKIGWGPSDQAMFAYAEGILDRQPEPFFAEITTLSNHWDFLWPYPTASQTPPATGDEWYVGYTRGITYTDWAIGDFVARMATKPWFANTLFVFVGDHGIWFFPEDRELATVEKQEAYFRVPLILFAPRLLQPDLSHAIGSQVDIAPTLLELLGIRAPNAFVGRSLLDREGARERFALLSHVGQWHLRVGNRYLFDVGRDFFFEHFPPPPAGTRPKAASEHVLLVSDADLLRVADPGELAFGSEEERRRLLDWGSKLVELNRQLLAADRIYPAAEGSPPRP